MWTRLAMVENTTTGKTGLETRPPRLSRDEERDLIRRLRLGDTAAATRLITSHLAFVRHIARRYRNYGHPLTELIQEGTVGLLEAVKRFNPDRDVRLATYAMWWIRASIQDYVVRSRSLVKIGTTAAQKSLFFNLRRRMGELIEGELPSEDFAALAERFNTTVADVLSLARRIAGTDQSLDSTITRDGDTALIDQVADERPNPEELVAADEFRIWYDKLTAALANLPPRELFIIQRRFLADIVPSREAIGKELGLSKERVRQLEIRALDRLRGMLQTALEATPFGKTA